MRLTMILMVALITTPLLGWTQKSSLSSSPASVARDLSVKEFQRMMESKPGVLLDVRTPGEVKRGAIKGSINIDFFDDAFDAKVEQLDKSKPVYIYCAVGGRSGEAMELMRKKGFRELYNLNGGYSAWMRGQ